MRFKSLSITKGFAFFKMIKNIFIIIAILGIVFNVFGLWKEHHQLEPILGELGGKLFNPMYSLYESSSIISDTGFYVNTGHLFSDVWHFLRNIYSLLEPIFFMYISIYYLFLLSKHILIGDKGRDFNAVITLSVIYILLQFLYISIFTDLPLKTLFSSIGNMFKIISNIFGK